MPAARNRIQVTPSETVARLLTELSALTGQGQATIIRELLDEAVPALEMTLGAFRSIKARPEEAQAAVLRMAEQAQQMVTQARLDLDSAMQKKPGRKRKGSDPAAAGVAAKKRGRGAAKPR